MPAPEEAFFASDLTADIAPATRSRAPASVAPPAVQVVRVKMTLRDAINIVGLLTVASVLLMPLWGLLWVLGWFLLGKL